MAIVYMCANVISYKCCSIIVKHYILDYILWPAWVLPITIIWLHWIALHNYDKMRHYRYILKHHTKVFPMYMALAPPLPKARLELNLVTECHVVLLHTNGLTTLFFKTGSWILVLKVIIVFNTRLNKLDYYSAGGKIFIEWIILKVDKLLHSTISSAMR